jgi:hypothetical protein
MSRDNRCSCCRMGTQGGGKWDEQEIFRLQDRTALIPDVSAGLLLSSRESMTLGVGAIFSGLFHTMSCQSRGWFTYL